MAMRVVTFKVEDEVFEALKYISNRSNMTVSELIRRSIARYVVDKLRYNTVRRTRRLVLYGGDYGFDTCFYNCFKNCYLACREKVLEGGERYGLP